MTHSWLKEFYPVTAQEVAVPRARAADIVEHSRTRTITVDVCGMCNAIPVVAS